MKKGEYEALKIKEMKGYNNQIGRGGTCGFGTSRILNIREKTSILKNNKNNLRSNHLKNTPFLESNLSISKL